MSNSEIRSAIAGAGVRHYQVAKGLGIAPETLSKKLRNELPEKEKKRIMAIIAALSRK